MHRARVFFHLPPLLACAALALAALSGVVPARAAAVPQLFAVLVPEADAQRALQLAMRVVLVRLTGTRDAAVDPALSGIIDDAAHYVRLERATTAGATQVIFDDLRLRAAISAAGRNIWDLDRPVLQVWLPALEAAPLDALRAQLTGAAQDRGLPLLIGSDAGTADHAALLAAARRAGASAALLAQSAPDSAGMWQWTLLSPQTDGQWVGSAEEGIDGATDALVRSAQTLEAAPVAAIDCRITGVANVGDFSAVLDAIRATPGVTAVNVRAIDGDALSLQIAAHGSAPTLAHALAGERLVPLASATNDALAYRYQAGP
jgi:hypothetical protein